MKLAIVDINNKSLDEVELDGSVFSAPFRPDILARTVEWQLARKQAGTHSTKMISEVSGTGKKSVRQKGTGGARHHSRRAVQFRGGAIIFGPRPRSHEKSLPKKVRAMALRVAISQKLRDGELIIVDNFASMDAKTSSFVKVVKNLNLESSLIVDAAQVPSNVKQAIANCMGHDCIPDVGLNVYDILRKKNLVLTVAAAKSLEQRLKQVSTNE